MWSGGLVGGVSYISHLVCGLGAQPECLDGKQVEQSERQIALKAFSSQKFCLFAHNYLAMT